MDAAADILRDLDNLPRRDTPSMRAVRKHWSKTLRAASAEEVLATAAALETRSGQTGKWLAYELIRFHPGAFAAVTEVQIEPFAARAQSWYAVDALGTILTGPLWAQGRLADGRVEAWSRSPDLWLRRSALVATVGLNARASGGPGDAARTLPVCRRLAPDREDMVVKALSWALRALSQRDRPAVERFMAEMDAVLAPRVKREVRHKLQTGLKTPRKARNATAD
ncbi:DNA alkylation repair protein [Phenylobacterium sp.]|uniref:DNA alkylation repair protein n=1 Tax=Phenylobacterium sp. TaxID=1871053 RepID=UPI002C0680BF|nr:DNA alkylation repair protein [Phenylobacterium sp.]HLZ75881.1 DNA alkylation repair protein [Phenylobacterium sp.]